MMNVFYANDLSVAIFTHPNENALQNEVNKWLSEQKKTIEVVQMLQSCSNTQCWMTIVYKKND